MRSRTPGSRVYRAFSLIEIMIVAVIIVAMSAWLASVYLGKSTTGDKGSERVTSPIGRAQNTVCASNLDQLRKSLTLLQNGDEEGKYPASLSELKFPSEMLSCPDGHEPYQYDPSTGQVRCIHRGHENL